MLRANSCMLGDDHENGLARLCAPGLVILRAQAFTHGLNEHPHRFSFHRNIAFDAQDIALAGEFHDGILQQLRIGDFAHFDHDCIKIVMASGCSGP